MDWRESEAVPPLDGAIATIPGFDDTLAALVETPLPVVIKNIAKRRLSAALRDWQACELPQEYYMMQNASGDDATRVNIGSKRIF